METESVTIWCPECRALREKEQAELANARELAAMWRTAFIVVWICVLIGGAIMYYESRADDNRRTNRTTTHERN